MFSKDKINIFISYSWDSPEHKKWVYNLADRLIREDFNVIIDVTHLKLGYHTKLFMEAGIKKCEWVLLIITSEYTQKANLRNGGVGYEYNIINNELYEIIHINDKFIPIVKQKERDKILPDFLRDFIYLDMSNELEYDSKYKELVNRLKNIDAKISDFISEETYLEESQQKKEIGQMTSNDEINYKEIDFIKNKINENFSDYFDKVFKLSIDESLQASGIKVKKLKGNDGKHVSSLIKKWEKDTNDYQESFNKIFNPNKLDLYENFLDDFKNKQFRFNLWTVKAAMSTKDPDLARYKKDFAEVLAEDILETLKIILANSAQYIDQKAAKINYAKLETVNELELDFLNEPELSLKKIIGYGIRSEILHRKYPAHFPVMTQRSLWGMYFLTSLENEFITIEEKKRKEITRVSHNWTYDYARFTYYNNYLYNLITNKLKNDYNIEINPNIRFGYCNMFLTEVANQHKSQIKDLHQWTDFDE